MIDHGNKEYKKPLVGMRIIKTVVAAFICMVIDYFRGEIPLQSVFTSAICMQTDRKNTLNSATSRVGGTIIGAVFAVLYLAFRSLVHITPFTIIDYFAICVFMLFLIVSVNKAKFYNGIIVSIVLFLSISLTHNTVDTFWAYVFNRVFDTLLGIFVAIPVNLILPQQEHPQ